MRRRAYVNAALLLVIGAMIGVAALAVVQAATSGETEVRITAQRLDDGRTEFGLQQRVDGEWGERLLPSSRFFPARVTPGRWLNSTPLVVSVTIEDPPDVAADSQSEPHADDPSGDDAGSADGEGGAATGEGEGGEDTGNEEEIAPYEPVEVEFNELTDSNEQGVYRWLGTELGYRLDGSAYVLSRITTSNSAGGVRFEVWCDVSEGNERRTAIYLYDLIGSAHKIFSTDPASWRWSSKLQFGVEAATAFEDAFAVNESGQIASASASSGLIDSLSQISAMRLFYLDGRSYASIQLNLLRMFDSYVGDNILQCDRTVFPEWASTRVAAERAAEAERLSKQLYAWCEEAAEAGAPLQYGNVGGGQGFAIDLFLPGAVEDHDGDGVVCEE